MKKWLVATSVVLLLAGCSSNDDPHANHKNHGGDSAEQMTIPEVKMTFDPAEVTAGTETTLDAHLTLNGKGLTDADDVKFEIWQEGQKDSEHEMVEVKHAKDGHYKLKKTFAKAGQWYVTYHIEAEGLHVMDKVPFTVK